MQDRPLTGTRVVVFGASGNVGHGAALDFERAGARALAPTRSKEERPDHLFVSLGPWWQEGVLAGQVLGQAAVELATGRRRSEVGRLPPERA